MTSAEREEVLTIAKLAVNEYFDHYLADVFPAQMDRMFMAHDLDVNAHRGQFQIARETDPTRRKLDRVLWLVLGATAAGAAAGTGLGKLLDLLGRLV